MAKTPCGTYKGLAAYRKHVEKTVRRGRKWLSKQELAPKGGDSARCDGCIQQNWLATPAPWFVQLARRLYTGRKSRGRIQ